jgi:hypothetical protein
MHCTGSKGFYERTVRLENVLIPESRKLHPFEALSIEALRLTAEALDNPHGQLNVSIVVGMGQSHQMAAGHNFHTELLT